jgi:hypothetical protein
MAKKGGRLLLTAKNVKTLTPSSLGADGSSGTDKVTYGPVLTRKAGRKGRKGRKTRKATRRRR